jgi:hypothetical protein
MVFFHDSIVAKKKKTIVSVTFFDGFVATKWWPLPFLWFCYEEGDNNNVVTFLYGGGVVEKTMARGRRLRKSGGGDLEVDKQNVVVSNQVGVEQNVVQSNQIVVQQNVAGSN